MIFYYYHLTFYLENDISPLFSFHLHSCFSFYFFFFNDTATTEIYTLSLHDALPIYPSVPCTPSHSTAILGVRWNGRPRIDRKSTRLNSSHSSISYAVFCLKKKKHQTQKIIYNH